MIGNISSLVAPGGWLMLGLTRGMTDKIFYFENSGKSFPCIDVTDDDIRIGYRLGGFDLSTLVIDGRTASPNREYKKILMVMGRKQEGYSPMT